jgi:hypothetical protein
MSWFNAQVQLDLPATRLTDDLADQMLKELQDFHPSLSAADGLTTARLSLLAENLPQASRIAIAVLEQAAAGIGHPAGAVAVTVMTEQEFTAREGWNDSPEAAQAQQMIPLKEAAEMLQISRQAVAKRLELPVDHPDHLQGQQDGSRRWFVSRSDVRRAALRRSGSTSTEGAATSTNGDIPSEVTGSASRHSTTPAPGQAAS